MKKFCLILLFSVISYQLLIVSSQAIPQKISFQGVLKDASGNLVTGNKDITFSIYDVAAGGTALWNETQTVSVEAGLYTVGLGSATPIPLTTFDGDTRYLGINIDGAELSPRVMMLSVPFAFNADRLGGYSVGVTGAKVVPLTDGSGLLSPSVIPSSGSSGQFVSLGPTTIQATDAAEAIWVRTTKDSAVAISAEATGLSGAGVYGKAVNVGGLFVSSANDGKGISGQASGTSGRGIYGYADSLTGTTYGVYGKADSGSGRGVYGESPFYGVYGKATGATARGVYGETANATGQGIQGYASSTTGLNYGGLFSTESNQGYGIYAHAKSTSGVNYGVYGRTSSDSGFAGFFTGGQGIKVETGSMEVTNGTLILKTSHTPPTSSSPGELGMFTYGIDPITLQNYIYVYTLSGWRRATLEAY